MTPLTQFCRDRGINCASILAEAPPGGEWPVGATHWMVTLTRGNQRVTTEYHQGPAHKAPPRAADVLYSLLADAAAGEQPFAAHCAEYGYDPDSRRAYSEWETCQKLAPRLRAFLGDLWGEAEEAAREH